MSADPTAPPTQPFLTVAQLDKWHGRTHVLRNVSLTVNAHERVVVCGPSGSGKSTLLRCLNGLESPQSGRILIDGTELEQGTVARGIVRREVGMVFQSFNLFPHMTVLDNCTLAPIWVRKMTSASAEDLALTQLTRVHLSAHAHKYPSELSGGEQQRVAIARALCMAPKVMLFDEPTSALDPEMIKEVLDIIMSLADAGMTMICVTHEMGFARRAADRIVFMDRGEIVEQGPPDQMFDNPKTERLKVFLSKTLHTATTAPREFSAAGSVPPTHASRNTP
jgi:general L-amino acid transport system ATP-binding protein